jgi:lysophospholipase L1-like esterase
MRWIDKLDPRGSSRGAWTAVVTTCILGCGTAREQGAPERTAASTAAVAGQGAPPPPTTADAGLPAVEDGGASDGDTGDAGGGTAFLSADPPRKRSGELARFYTALDGLTAGTRKDHVRILWLGDSHGQADFWSGKLRSILQRRFGHGGPGFVHVGHKSYRHDGVELILKDKWTMVPGNPATSKVTGDGVLGLGGLLTSPKNPGAEAAVEVRDAALTGKLHWDLCVRFGKAGDEITVSLTDKKPFTLKAGNKLAERPPLQHMKLFTEAGVVQAGAGGAGGAKDEAAAKKDESGKKKGPRLTVQPTVGYPSFCGVVIETDPTEAPGVVLDVAGINGARYTTALAWDEEAWMAEFMRRSPDLVIFEYGTNESGDVGIKPETYEDRVTRLVGRIRKKKPDTDCAILAPTERADQEERSARIRDIFRDAAKANGCFFWDTIEAMGGKGAMRTWRDRNPPFGAQDGIHLTVKGYFELGEKLAADLMKRY